MACSAADLFTVEKVIGIVAFEFAGKFCLEVGRVEMSNGSCAAHALCKVREIFLDIVSQRVKGSDPGYYNSSLFHKEISFVKQKLPVQFKAF